jgi:ABC-type branched-subunit amino acid transport system permease subunit
VSRLGTIQKHLAGVVLMLLVMSIPPLVISQRYVLGELIVFMLWASVAIQWNVLMGHAGVFSLGQMLFFAIGAYTVGMSGSYLGLSPWLSMPAGAAVAAAAALAIGFACLRLATAYVALLTFAIVYMVHTLIITDAGCFTMSGGICQPLFGGGNGFSSIPDFGFRLLLKGNWILGNYFVVLASLGLSLAASILVIHGRLGLAFRALRDSSIYAASRGLSPTRFHIVAFVITAFFTGLSGAVYATHFRFAGPSLFELPTLVFILSMVIVGGLRSTWGPVFGAAAMMLLVEVAKGMGDVRNTAIRRRSCALRPVDAEGHSRSLRRRGIGAFGAAQKDTGRGARKRSIAAKSVTGRNLGAELAMPHQADLLEPAIPAHLRVERTRPLNAPTGFSPQHSSYSARFDSRVKCLPMVYLGIQSRPHTDVRAVIAMLKSGLRSKGGPSFFDEARFVDDRGYVNVVLVGYWDDRQIYDRWNAALPEGWWYDGLTVDGPIGAFREAYTPSVTDTETTFSHPHPEGYATIADHMSGKTDTHEYWGSARDRIPRAQTEDLDPDGEPRASLAPGQETLGRRVDIAPYGNLCLLRSGQDWSGTEGEERAFYLGKVRPLLERGMAEISREGLRLGCYFNRHLRVEGTTGPVEKTYSVSAWHSLAHLEAWVKADTHLAIWAAGIKHFKLAGDAAKLRLYHELMVLKREDQSFSYFNCHRDTGMLRRIGR